MKLKNQQINKLATKAVIKELESIKSIIKELQQLNDLLRLDLTALQEITICINQEKAELVKALKYIQACDNATQSAAKAIETLKNTGEW